MTTITINTQATPATNPTSPATERGSAHLDPQISGGPMRLADLVEGYWAITAPMHDEIRSIYAAHMRGEKIDISAVEARIGRPLANERKPYQVESGVALISMEGVISPKANLFMQISGGTSAQQLRADIQAATEDASVKSAILLADSPGGNVLGVAEVAQALAALTAAKPTITWSGGTLASAAYWIGSAASAVYISGPMVNVGSIGVRTEVIDTSMADAAAGRKRTIIAAGKYKAAGDGPLTPETAAYKQAQVDYLYSLFVDAVAINRGVSAAQVLADMADGRVFIGQQAIDAGLVDGVASLEQLVQAMATDPQSVVRRRVKRKSAAQLAAPESKSSKADASTGDVQATADPAAPSSEPVVPAAEGDTTTHLGDVMATPDNTAAGGITTAEALAAAHPALTEQIRATAHAAGMTAGAQAERDRIAAVRAQALPGHEALVDKLAMDGKTTGPEAAVAILSAERSLKAGAAAAHFADAPGAAPASPHAGGDAEREPKRRPSVTSAYAALNKSAHAA